MDSRSTIINHQISKTIIIKARKSTQRFWWWCGKSIEEFTIELAFTIVRTYITFVSYTLYGTSVNDPSAFPPLWPHAHGILL